MWLGADDISMARSRRNVVVVRPHALKPASHRSRTPPDAALIRRALSAAVENKKNSVETCRSAYPANLQSTSSPIIIDFIDEKVGGLARN
jgi:hypothetical protein